MTEAERYREFVAEFETQCSGLGKPQVMRIGRLTDADQATLRCHKLQMACRALAGTGRFAEYLRFAQTPHASCPLSSEINLRQSLYFQIQERGGIRLFSTGARLMFK
jgi:hypothetical protein